MHDPLTLRHGRPEDAGLDPQRIELIRERARSWVAAGDSPSLVLLAARRGVIVLEEAYGILRPSDGAPLRTDSIFPVMSITKPVAAAAVLCLVEDGLLSLKHPIADLLPEITAPGTEQVLIADLVTHTSGYDDMTVFPHVAPRFADNCPVPDAAPDQYPDLNRLIHYAGDAPLSHAPGEVMCYCNFGYALIGDIVRRVSGMSFARFVTERLFQPLGMGDSYLVLPAELRRSRRVFRRPELPDLPALFRNWPPQLVPSVDSETLDAYDGGWNGMKTTARDIAVFAQMLLNGGTYGGQRVLSRASVKAMTSPQLPPGIRSIWSLPDPHTGAPMEFPIRGGNYGFGLFILGRDDRTVYFNGTLQSSASFGHMGHLMSSFWADPEEEVVGVCLSVPSGLRPLGTPLWHGDHFQDMVHAAVLD